jgi:hypothetical protein
MTDWAEEIERLAHSLSVTEKDGWILVESERARQIAQALRDLVRDRIELEEEISIWRSFMVPEPVVRYQCEEKIESRVADSSGQMQFGGTTSEEDADKAVLEAIEKENDRLWR